MGTDIYGGIEYRHPGAGSDWYEGDAWLKALSLFPLYDENDYAAFACLFGVRNYAGFTTPIAADRGLPIDVSAGFRDLEPWLAAGEMVHASWVDWAELAALDPLAAPERYVGRLILSAKPSPWLTHERLVAAEWSARVREEVGPPPPGWHPATERMEWETEDLNIRYRSLSIGTVLGPDSQWTHVFAVMRALAGRFGPEGVRLVVAFDC